MEKALYLNGKKYISARRAAALVGYTPDYVGQLARAQKLDSTLVGRSWYIEEESILAHKAQSPVSLRSFSKKKKSKKAFVSIDELSEEVTEIKRSLGKEISPIFSSGIVYSKEKNKDLLFPRISKKLQVAVHVPKRSLSRFEHATLASVVSVIVVFMFVTAFLNRDDLKTQAISFTEQSRLHLASLINTLSQEANGMNDWGNQTAFAFGSWTRELIGKIFAPWNSSDEVVIPGPKTPSVIVANFPVPASTNSSTQAFSALSFSEVRGYVDASIDVRLAAFRNEFLTSPTLPNVNRVYLDRQLDAIVGRISVGSGSSSSGSGGISLTDLSVSGPLSYNSGTGAFSFDFSTANNWTGLNTFANASTTSLSAEYASSTVAYFGTLNLPSLSDGCLDISSGVISSTGVACGSGSGGFAWDVNSDYNSTSTTLAFLDGFFSTASSTISGDLRLPSLTQGFAYIGSTGKVNTTASSSINLSWFNNDAGFLTSLSGAASSTLLVDSNTWTGANVFQGLLTNTYASSTYSSFTSASTTNLIVNGESFNDLTGTGLALSGNALVTSNIPNASLQNSTISGIALGSSLADLTATDSTLTFSGTYNGATAQTIGLNLGNANTWTAKQNFFGSASSTLLSANWIKVGGTASTTIDTAGNLVTQQATSTNLAITNITASLLKTNGDGSVIPAIAGTDYQVAGTYLTALGSGYASTSQSAVAFSTSTLSFNGLTVGQNIVPTAGALTFTPTITGTLDNTGLTNSSITVNGSSVSLGGSITVSSTTLLTDTNTWSGVNRFSFASTTYGSFTTASTTNLNLGGQSFVSLLGSGLSNNSGILTVSGLSTSNFTSANVSQWTNDAGYLTSSIDGFDFSYGQNLGFGFTGSATSTRTKFAAGLLASSTSFFDYASTTQLDVTGSFATSTFAGSIDVTGANRGIDAGAYFYGANLSECADAADKLIWNNGVFSCGADAGAGGGITSLGAQYSTASTDAGQTFATSSADANIELIITTSGSTHTFDANWTGTLAAGRGGTGISNPSAAGILLGSYAGGSWQQLATSSLNISTSDLNNDAGFLTGVAWGDITGTLSNQTDLANAFYGKLGTSTTLTTGQVLFASGANTVSSVATGTVSVPTGLTATANRYVLGGNLSIGLDTGYVIPLQSTLDSFLTGYDAWTHPASGISATTSQLTVAGILSTASSTISGDLRLPSLTQGFAYIGSTGKVNTTASSSINLSWFNNDAGFLTSLSGAASSTLLVDSNTWTGANVFQSLLTNTYASSTYSSFTTASTTNLIVNGESFNDLTGTGLAISGNALVTSNIPNASLQNSTISGISLGSNLADLTATDSTLTFSGTYNGSTARTIGLNLGNANTWTAKQDFFGSASSTLLSANQAWFGGTGTTTITNAGWVGQGTSSPFAQLSVNSEAGNPAFVVGSSTATSFIVDASGRVGVGTASPLVGLHVQNNQNSFQALAAFRNSSTSGSSGVGRVVIAADDYAQLAFFNDTDTDYSFAPEAMISYDVTSGDLILYNSELTDLVIDSGGRVGIGTANPTARLEVSGGILATASSTIVGDLRLPSLTQGFAYIGSGGKLNSTASSSVNLSWFNNDAGFLTTDSTASTTLLSDDNTWTGINSIASNLFNVTGLSDGCVEVASGFLTSTGSNCGTGSGGITSLGAAGQSQTGSSQTFATSTSSFNGLTAAITIVSSGNTHTFTPTLTGTLDNAGLTNSTISGISLGSNLADLTATNGTLTFSGTYNGSTARTIGLNLGSANTWTAKQDFFGAASSTLLSANQAWFGGTGTTTITNAGWVGVGSSTPWGLLSVNANGLSSGAPQFVVGSSTATNFIVANNGNVGVGTVAPGNNLEVRKDSTGLNASVMGNYGFSVSESDADGIALGSFGTYKAIQTFGNTPLVLNPVSNKVGIGDTSPDARLSFGEGVSDSILHLYEGGTNSNYGFGVASGDLRIFTGSGARISFGQYTTSMQTQMTLGTTGNLGIGETSPGSKLSVSGGATVGASYDTLVAPTNGLLIEGITGIGTTTPYYNLTIASTTGSQLSLSAGAGFAQTVFRNDGTNLYISTTTVAGTATTSISALEIALGGFGTTTLRGLNIVGQATSTSNVGFNITGGCYAIGGTCLSTGGSGASSTLLADSNTWSGTNNFISNVGIGTSSPYANLSIQGIAGQTNNLFAIASSSGETMLAFGINDAINSPPGNPRLQLLFGNYNNGEELLGGQIATPGVSDGGDLSTGASINLDTGSITFDDSGEAGGIQFQGGEFDINAIGNYSSLSGGGINLGAGKLNVNGSDVANGASIFISGGGWDGSVYTGGSIDINSASSNNIGGNINIGSAGYLYMNASDYIELSSDLVYASGEVFVVGTTTGAYRLVSQSNNAPQLSLSAGAGFAQTVFRNDGTNLYISTTTVAGTATTSISALEIALGGLGTTTVRGLNISGQATSTSNVGFNITGGCYAIGGTCLSTGGSGASSTLLADFNTFSNTNNFTDSVGLSTTSPFARLSVNALAGEHGFVIGSTTGTSFIVDRNGRVGVGSSTPYAQVSIVNSGDGITVPTIALAHSDGTRAFEIRLGTTGQDNTLIGKDVGKALSTTGGFNTALGSEALSSLTTGDENVAIGYQTMLNSTLAIDNIAIGNYALTNNQGRSNVAIGSTALFENINGQRNVAIGTCAICNGNATNTVAIGYQAGVNINGAEANTLLGYQAGGSLTSGSFNTSIGYNVTPISNTGFSQLNIGNVIYGTGLYSGTSVSSSAVSTSTVGIGTSTPSALARLTLATSTGSQLSLSAGAGFAQTVFRNDGTNLYISTTTVAGTATTSISALEIALGGFGTTTVRGLNISGQATSTSNVGFNITGGCYAISGNCLSASSLGALTSYDAWTHPSAGISATTSLMLFNGQASSTQLSAYRAYFGGTATSTFLNDGSLGMGTSTTYGKLSIWNTVSTSGSDAVAGIYASTTLSLGTASGFQFGNRYINNIQGTEAGTQVGTLIRMIDGTSLANTVRGLEVQAYSGNNTSGVNTAVAAFGKTFGVHAYTDGLAGAVAQPAAVFAELGHATNGNAIRAYSSAATAAVLLSVYQEDAAFTGTGLQMDLGNDTGGSFASGNFIDLKKAGATQWIVKHDGTTGIATATPWRTLSVTGTVGFSSSLSSESGNDEVLCIDPTTYEVTMGGASCAASSIRFKENVADLSYGLDTVLSLRPVSYNYIESERRAGDENRYLGFIAEEMLDIIPEVVEFDKEGLPGGIDYAKITPVLAKAIQELHGRLASVESGFQSQFGPSASSSEILGEQNNAAIALQPANATTTIFNLDNESGSAFAINARGDITHTGIIVVKNDTFAGSTVTGDDGAAEIIFDYDLGTGKPVVQLTVESETPAFAQIASWQQDSDGRYTGLVLKTFNPDGTPASTTVHFLVTGKQTGYTTQNLSIASNHTASSSVIILNPNNPPVVEIVGDATSTPVTATSTPEVAGVSTSTPATPDTGTTTPEVITESPPEEPIVTEPPANEPEPEPIAQNDEN